MMLTEVKINGVDVTEFVVNYEYERTFGDYASEIEIKFVRNVANLLSIGTGQEIIIKRGWVNPTDETIFRGIVERSQPEAGTITVIGKDRLWELVKREVTRVYESTGSQAGKLSEIFKDLVTTFGGLNADSTTIQDSGTLFILEKYVCNHADVFERCRNLANALDWQFYYRADTDKVYFEPKGFSNNNLVLRVGSNVYGLPKWNYDITDMINDLTINGAFQEIERTENGQIGVTSGYTTTSVNLSFTPISVKVFWDASNPPTTLRVGGLPDSTAVFNYFVDKTNKKILPKPGTTFPASNYLETRYSHAVPIPVHMYDQESIDTYSRFTKTLTFTDLRTVADAEVRALKILDKYSTPFIYTTLKVRNDPTFNLSVGQLIRVVDNISQPNHDNPLVITKHRIRYPADFDEVDVGDKYYRLAEWQGSVEERIKRLNEFQFDNQDLITEIVNIDNSLNNSIDIRPVYRQVFQQNLAGDTLIWGNSAFGIWNEFKWGNSFTNSFVLGHSAAGVLGTAKLGSNISDEILHFTQQYLNTYTEQFKDTDFKDSTTNANWNTTTNQLTFTSGQFALSKSIDYNNGAITQAKLTATISSGSFNLQMSADGTNFENATNGTTHTFTNSGTNLKWKITENGGGTGTITKIVLSDYH